LRRLYRLLFLLESSARGAGAVFGGGEGRRDRSGSSGGCRPAPLPLGLEGGPGGGNGAAEVDKGPAACMDGKGKEGEE